MESTDLGTISHFLSACPASPRPRNAEAVPPELDSLLRRFVEGELGEDELLEMYRELRGNEYAMEMLASLLNGE